MLDGDHYGVGIHLNPLDARVDLLGGLRAAGGQIANLLRDDGKAASILAGPRRLDRRVQREQVRLAGEVRDHLHDFADVLCAFAQPLDLLDGLQRHLAHGAHALRGTLRRLAPNVRDLNGLFGTPRHALDGARHLQNLLGLVLRAAGQLGRRFAHLRRVGTDNFAGGAHVRQQAAQRLQHGIQRLRHRAEGGRAELHADIHIALAYLLQVIQQLEQAGFQ